MYKGPTSGYGTERAGWIMQKDKVKLFFRWVTPVTFLIAGMGVHASDTSISLADQSEIPVEIFPADGDTLVILLPSEYGIQPGHRRLARALADADIETWVVDIFSGYFLPVAASSLSKVPGTAVSELIEHAHSSTSKQSFLVSNDKGAVLVLSGASAWQEHHPQEDGLGGAVMISPYLIEGTPGPGEDPRYLAIASATNLPVYVIQPALSPSIKRLENLAGQLQLGGSDVFLHVLPAVRNRFFFRPDATPVEDKEAHRLALYVKRATWLLSGYETRRTAVPKHTGTTSLKEKKKSGRLIPYTGNLEPPPLLLTDLNGRYHQLEDYRGHVILVNFWASWCPPCVHEMPSLEALSKRYRHKPFQILAVNMEEQKETVAHFVETSNITFPVLLDKTGRAVQDWKISAYPTTLIVGREGRLKYGLIGAVDWEDAGIRRVLDDLME